MSSKHRNALRPTGNVHGVLVLDKPGQITSHGVVSAVRRAFGTRQVGHAGTLDPMATGVLVVLLGEATKLSSVLTTEVKSYQAEVCFGTTTDTLDAEGKITRRVALQENWLDEVQLKNSLDFERKRTLQIPPQVSAIKVEGQRAYARARRGQITDLAPRDVQVHSLRPTRISDDRLSLEISVSKGYYVRALARDLGDALGVGAHLTALRRTQSGFFTLNEAMPWPPNKEMPLLSLAEVTRKALASVQINEEGALRLAQGKRVSDAHIDLGGPLSKLSVAAAFSGERLVALIEACENAEFRVKRGFNDPSTT